jgi:hypothetical protein
MYTIAAREASSVHGRQRTARKPPTLEGGRQPGVAPHPPFGHLLPAAGGKKGYTYVMRFQL